MMSFFQYVTVLMAFDEEFILLVESKIKIGVTT